MTKTLELPAEFGSLASIADFIDKNLDVNNTIKSKLGIVCDEIASNIVNYSEATYIRLKLFYDSDRVVLEFRDNGKPFNPLEIEEPDLSENLESRPEGGLGIFLVKKLMTTVSYSYQEKENILSMEKIIK